MTKADLAQNLFDAGICNSKNESFEVVDLLLDLMKNTLAKGEQIKISGFGNFTVKLKHPRKGRNPQTGETIVLDGRKVLSFKASTILRNKVQIENRD